MINFIAFIFTLMLSQNDVLVQQSGVSVPLSDVDSYFHEIPPDIRTQLSYDPLQLEQDIIGMLNMNIIYDHIQSQGLVEQSPFKNVIQQIKSKPLDMDASVYKSLGVSADEFEKNYRHYLIKKALYSTLQDYLLQQIDEKKATRLAHDRFLVNQKQYRKPQKRDIGMIKLSMDKYSQDDVLALVKDLLKEDTAERFSDLAGDVSTDKTVEYNAGQLGQFHQAGFRYPFAETVFTADKGVVPAVFQQDDAWYIVRVNDIIAGQPGKFADHQDDLVARIKNEMMERQFQYIIDQYAKNSIEVNKELVADVFRRYEVFQ